MASTDTTEQEAGRRRGARPTSGKYVVLFAALDAPHDYRAVVDDDNEAVMFNGGQEAAKRAALQQPQVKEQLDTDGTVLLVAVPAASWRPVQARMEQPDPVLRLS